jgi:pimeloyl-ACP methyl ester carboxylesterase
MGEGTPTLILESGGGLAASQWTELLPELAKQTRVISYSPAGFGRSTTSGYPGSPQSSVNELRQLLKELGVTGPVVLAGHSWGALLARLYVSTFPDDVVGLVLIDGTHEAQCARWESLDPSYKCIQMFQAAMSGAGDPVRDVFEQIIRVQSTQHVDGLRPLPDIPLAVITAAKRCQPGVVWTCRDPSLMDVWRRLHDEWFERSTTGLRIVSAQTGHDVINDQPALILDAVKFVMSHLRTR